MAEKSKSFEWKLSGTVGRQYVTENSDIHTPDQEKDYCQPRLNLVRSRNECLVTGALALTLRVSRLMGVAPLRLVRERSGWRASTSRPFALYSYILLFTLHALCIPVTIYLSVVVSPTTYAYSSIVRYLEILDIILTIVLTATGAAAAPSRMKKMIQCLNNCQRINAKVQNHLEAEKLAEKKRYFVAVIFLAAIIPQFLVEFYNFPQAKNNTYISGKYNPSIMTFIFVKMGYLFIYLCYNMDQVLALLVEMQYVFIALLVNSTLRNSNDYISDIIRNLEIPRITATAQLLDSVDNKIVVFQATQRVRRAQRYVQCFRICYIEICKVMRQVNHSYEKVLLIQLLCLVSRLIIVPIYFLFLTFTFPDIGAMAFVLQTFYFTMDLALIVLLVEPGYRTEKEMQRTGRLVAALLRRVSSPRDALALEVDHLYDQILLNKISYQPLGMFTLSRPLITSVLSAVTTYLLIMMQFQEFDNNKMSHLRT